MDFIAQYWWLWLIGLLIFGGLMTINQRRRVRGMMRPMSNFPSNLSFGEFDKSFQQAADSFQKGFGSMMLFWVLFVASGVLLLISVVVNIFQAI